MNRIPTVCILAGGLGTRLGDRSQSTPKVLTDVGGEPFLFHQLRLIAMHGAREVVLCVGHLGEMVEEVLGAQRFGLDMTTAMTPLDSTAHSERYAAHGLSSKIGSWCSTETRICELTTGHFQTHGWKVA